MATASRCIPLSNGCPARAENPPAREAGGARTAEKFNVAKTRQLLRPHALPYDHACAIE
jgi:hypothetical protein